MNGYHRTGTPCYASSRPCPLAPSEHFDSLDDLIRLLVEEDAERKDRELWRKRGKSAVDDERP